MGIAIAASLVIAPALILSPQFVQAQQSKEISGEGFGSMACSDDSRVVHGPITFSAREDDKGKVTGDFRFEAEGKFPREIGGFFNGGHITEDNRYDLTGISSHHAGDGGEICLQGVFPFTLTGECGQGVRVKLVIEHTPEFKTIGEFIANVVCNAEDPILRGSFTVSQAATTMNPPVTAIPGFAKGSHEVRIEIDANYEYNTATKALTVDQDSLKGVLWIDKGTSTARSFPLSDVSQLTVSPDFKTIAYKATINFGGSTTAMVVISGKISGTLTYDPAIDFEHAKDQTAKTSKMTLEIANVKLEVKRVLTGAIDFT